MLNDAERKLLRVLSGHVRLSRVNRQSKGDLEPMSMFTYTYVYYCINIHNRTVYNSWSKWLEECMSMNIREYLFFHVSWWLISWCLQQVNLWKGGELGPPQMDEGQDLANYQKVSFSIRLAISSAASHPRASAPNITQLCQWWRASLVPDVSGDESFDGLPLHFPRAWSSLEVVSLTLSQCALATIISTNLRDAAMAVLRFEQAPSGSTSFSTIANLPAKRYRRVMQSPGMPHVL